MSRCHVDHDDGMSAIRAIMNSDAVFPHGCRGDVGARWYGKRDIGFHRCGCCSTGVAGYDMDDAPGNGYETKDEDDTESNNQNA